MTAFPFTDRDANNRTLLTELRGVEMMIEGNPVEAKKLISRAISNLEWSQMFARRIPAIPDWSNIYWVRVCGARGLSIDVQMAAPLMKVSLRPGDAPAFHREGKEIALPSTVWYSFLSIAFDFPASRVPKDLDAAHLTDRKARERVNAALKAAFGLPSTAPNPFPGRGRRRLRCVPYNCGDDRRYDPPEESDIERAARAKVPRQDCDD